MLILNFLNVEELIFYDENIRQSLPHDMFAIFEQWKMSKRIPYLKSLGQAAILDFLNTANDDHIDILEKYFDQRIFIERLNYSIVDNFKIPIDQNKICEEFCKIVDYNYYKTWRDESFLYITFWR
jgi:hypothetical protein